MPKRIILLGDKLAPNGGVVITADEINTRFGRPVARKGDLVNCLAPYPDGRLHGINKIVDGDDGHTIGGIDVALESHKTECGCVLVASAHSDTATIGD